MDENQSRMQVDEDQSKEPDSGPKIDESSSKSSVKKKGKGKYIEPLFTNKSIC